MLSEKGQLADFQDEYLRKVLIKIQERDLIRCEMSNTQPDLQRSKDPDTETGDTSDGRQNLHSSS